MAASASAAARRISSYCCGDKNTASGGISGPDAHEINHEPTTASKRHLASLHSSLMTLSVVAWVSENQGTTVRLSSTQLTFAQTLGIEFTQVHLGVTVGDIAGLSTIDT